MVVHEDVGPRYPLSVQLSPYRFPPTGIGNGEVKAVFVQVVPETPGDDVSQRISEIVGHHLRFARCSRSEIHKRYIIVRIHVCGAYERSGVAHSLMEVFESLCFIGTYAEQMLYARTLGHGILNVLQNDLFAGGYNHFDIGGVASVYNVFFSQQMSGGNHRRSQFMKGDDAEPEFVTAF